MKFLPLLFAALPLIAQEPAPQPATPEAPAKNEAEPAEKPELPARGPSSGDEKLLELLKKNPTPEGRAKQAEQAAQKPESAPVKPDEKPPKVRDKTRTTLLPPVTSDDLEMRVRYRKARTIAERDPAVVAAWDESRNARTDYVKREALKRYYTLIRNKVLAIDRSVAPVLNERSEYSLRRLEQTRVEPTDPLEEDMRHRQ